MRESSVTVARLEWEPDNDFTFPLATEMLVNFDAEHFYVRFYQASPPTVLDGKAPDAVKAKLVTGAAIPLSKMEAIIKALQASYVQRLNLREEDLVLTPTRHEDAEDDNA